MKKLYVHLVSDSTGDTLQSISKAILYQFDNIKVKQYIWSLIETKPKLEKTIKAIKKRPGVVMHTLSNEEFIESLELECEKTSVPCIEVLKETTMHISNYLGKKPKSSPGQQHVIDKEYVKKINAINFSIYHDDGQNLEEVKRADIVIFGPSRTSKSPTSMYLASKGYKVINIPYVKGIIFHEELVDFSKTFVVGLTVCTDRLVEIRKNRLVSANETNETSYTDFQEVEAEMREFRRFCSSRSWQTIDITTKSIEETSARIIQMYYKWKKKVKSEDE